MFENVLTFNTLHNNRVERQVFCYITLLRLHPFTVVYMTRKDNEFKKKSCKIYYSIFTWDFCSNEQKCWMLVDAMHEYVMWEMFHGINMIIYI